LNNSKLISRARELRVNATKQENQLWYGFLRSYRPRFTRQRIVGSYILDFYCGKVKLVVELDGPQHFKEDSIEYDRIRTQFLVALGISVMRFTNTDVDWYFDEVCNAIDKKVNGLLGGDNPRRFAPPPSKEGG